MRKFLDLTMKQLSPFIVAVCICSFFSCKGEKEEWLENVNVIDIQGAVGKGKVVNLSQVAESISYIPLETNENSIFRQTPFPKIVYERGMVFYIQDDAIKVFNEQGDFLYTFDRLGRGPHEYLGLFNVHYDTDNDILCITCLNKLLEYSPKGEFIREVYYPQDAYNPNRGRKIGDDRYIVLESAIKTGFAALIFNQQGEILKRIEYPLEEYEFIKRLSEFHTFHLTYSFRYKDKIRLQNGINPYILGIHKDLSVDTAYIINYGKYSLKNAKNIPRIIKGMPYIQRYAYIYESDNYLFMEFRLGSLIRSPRVMPTADGRTFTSDISCALYNKKSGEFFFVDQPELEQRGLVDDLEGGPAFWPVYISNDDYMVSAIMATTLIKYVETRPVSENLKQIVHQINENSNPVLIVVKLKKDTENSLK